MQRLRRLPSNSRNRISGLVFNTSSVISKMPRFGFPGAGGTAEFSRWRKPPGIHCRRHSPRQGRRNTPTLKNSSAPAGAWSSFTINRWLTPPATFLRPFGTMSCAYAAHARHMVWTILLAAHRWRAFAVFEFVGCGPGTAIDTRELRSLLL